MRDDLTPAQKATNDLNSAMDSVTLINQLIHAGAHSEQIDKRVQSNYQHLEIVLKREHVIADITDKTPFLDAIAAGKAFAPVA
jgi:hypothetical protein